MGADPMIVEMLDLLAARPFNIPAIFISVNLICWPYMVMPEDHMVRDIRTLKPGDRWTFTDRGE